MDLHVEFVYSASVQNTHFVFSGVLTDLPIIHMGRRSSIGRTRRGVGESAVCEVAHTYVIWGRNLGEKGIKDSWGLSNRTPPPPGQPRRCRIGKNMKASASDRTRFEAWTIAENIRELAQGFDGRILGKIRIAGNFRESAWGVACGCS